MKEGLAKTAPQPARSPDRAGGSQSPQEKEAAGISERAGGRLKWALEASERLGVRMTEARHAVLASLAHLQAPANLSQIASDPSIRDRFDAATVYRTLMLFRDAEIVRELSVRDKARSFVLNSPDAARAYLVCRVCGKIEPLPQTALDPRLRKQATEAGYSKVEPELELRGLCPGCQRKPEPVISAKLPVSPRRT